MFQGNSNAAASALTSAVSNGAPASAAAQAVAQVTSPHMLRFLERHQGHGVRVGHRSPQVQVSGCSRGHPIRSLKNLQ